MMKLREATSTRDGQLLWSSLGMAHRYAEARHFMYGTRQRVQPSLHEGRLMWRVGKARPRPAPPLRCNGECLMSENGVDTWGSFRFRVLPADACSCSWWTECVGAGLNLPCAEQHPRCPVHPMEVAEPCSS